MITLLDTAQMDTTDAEIVVAGLHREYAMLVRRLCTVEWQSVTGVELRRRMGRIRNMVEAVTGEAFEYRDDDATDNH